MSKGMWLLVVLVLALCVPRAFAQDSGPDEEERWTKEQKAAHQKEVKQLYAEMKRTRNKAALMSRIERFGKEGTRVQRDALMLYVRRAKNQVHIDSCFKALAEIGGKKAVEFLTGKYALKSRDFMVQRSAAGALATAKDPRAIDALIEVMTCRFTKIQVVGGCANALAQSFPEDEKVVKTLFDFTRHKKDTIRSMTLSALGHLGTDEAVARLTEALEKDRNTRARGAAATGLGNTGRRDVIPLLKKAMARDCAFTVQQCCSSAIKRILGSD